MTTAAPFNWAAWFQAQRRGLAELCRTGVDPMPATKPLREILHERDQRPSLVPLRRCIDVAARLYDITPMDIISHRRRGDIVAARFLAVKLASDCRRDVTTPTIAAIFNRQESSLSHAVRRAEAFMEEDKLFRRRYQRARELL